MSKATQATEAPDGEAPGGVVSDNVSLSSFEMNDSSFEPQGGGGRLSVLIAARAPAAMIAAALGEGADPQDIEVMQALEDALHDDPAYASQLLNIDAIAQAWEVREEADHAWYGLAGAIEDDDVEGVSQAIEQMRSVGDTVSMTSPDGETFLTDAMARRASLEIIRMLVVDGGAHPDDFEAEAWKALRRQPHDDWWKDVEAFFLSLS